MAWHRLQSSEEADTHRALKLYRAYIKRDKGTSTTASYSSVLCLDETGRGREETIKEYDLVSVCSAAVKTCPRARGEQEAWSSVHASRHSHHMSICPNTRKAVLTKALSWWWWWILSPYCLVLIQTHGVGPLLGPHCTLWESHKSHVLPCLFLLKQWQITSCGLTEWFQHHTDHNRKHCRKDKQEGSKEGREGGKDGRTGYCPSSCVVWTPF